jgi:dephospho-CoA kinase
VFPADDAACPARPRIGGVLRVGLTGGIGSGKSEVSRRLAALGAVVIDADAIAREVVQPGTAGLAEVAGAFGDGVLLPDGSLDRPRLGEIVFADPVRRARLNAIVHPLVGARMAELQASAGPGAIVVHDVPLIAENSLAADYDVVVVVDAPPQVQAGRLARDRGMTAEQARARMAAQASPLADLDRQVTDLWSRLRRRGAAGVVS